MYQLSGQAAPITPIQYLLESALREMEITETIADLLKSVEEKVLAYRQTLQSTARSRHVVPLLYQMLLTEMPLIDFFSKQGFFIEGMTENTYLYGRPGRANPLNLTFEEDNICFGCLKIHVVNHPNYKSLDGSDGYYSVHDWALNVLNYTERVDFIREHSFGEGILLFSVPYNILSELANNLPQDVRDMFGKLIVYVGTEGEKFRGRDHFRGTVQVYPKDDGTRPIWVDNTRSESLVLCHDCVSEYLAFSEKANGKRTFYSELLRNKILDFYDREDEIRENYTLEMQIAEEREARYAVNKWKKNPLANLLEMHFTQDDLKRLKTHGFSESLRKTTQQQAEEIMEEYTGAYRITGTRKFYKFRGFRK